MRAANQGSGEYSQGCTGSPEPFVSRQSNKYQTLLLARNALSLSYMTSANALVSLHIRTGTTEPSSLYQNFLRWLK